MNCRKYMGNSLPKLTLKIKYCSTKLSIDEGWMPHIKKGMKNRQIFNKMDRNKIYPYFRLIYNRNEKTFTELCLLDSEFYSFNPCHWSLAYYCIQGRARNPNIYPWKGVFIMIL